MSFHSNTRIYVNTLINMFTFIVFVVPVESFAQVPGNPFNKLQQESFRGRYDNGPENLVPNEGGATWIEDTNINWVQLPDTNFRVRVTISRHKFRGGRHPFALKYRLNGEDLYRVTGSSSVIQACDSKWYTDNSHSSDDPWIRLGTGIWNEIENNGCVNGGDEATGKVSWPDTGDAVKEIDTEWCLRIIGSDVLEGDEIELQWHQVEVDPEDPVDPFDFCENNIYCEPYENAPIITVPEPSRIYLQAFVVFTLLAIRQWKSNS